MYLDDCPSMRRRRNLMRQTCSADHHGHTTSHHPRLSNPHRSRTLHRRTLAGPRFPPL